MTFASRPASKENMRLRNDSSNKFLTRSNVNQQRVSHSFRRAPRSFQIHHPRVSHSCRRASRSFQIRNSRSRSTEDRRPPCSASTTARIRGKGLNGAPLPCLPCFCSVSCAQLSFTLEPDDGLCAHMDERTCIRVITVDVTSSVQAENKCSAVAMWMVRHKQSQQKKKRRRKTKRKKQQQKHLANAAATAAKLPRRRQSNKAAVKKQTQRQKHSKGKRGSSKAAAKAASKQQQKQQRKQQEAAIATTKHRRQQQHSNESNKHNKNRFKTPAKAAATNAAVKSPVTPLQKHQQEQQQE